MSDDTSTTTDRVPHAMPQPASVRPGLIAPRITPSHLPELNQDWWRVIQDVRHLFEVSRHPRADLTWHRCKANLMVLEVYLDQRIRDANDMSDAAVLLLTEVRHYLGTHA